MASSGQSRLVRWGGRLLVGLLVLALGLWLAMKIASEPVPEGKAGPQADALARKVEQAVALDAWRATGAVRWNFGGRHAHLWDRTRRMHHIRWKEHEAVLRLSSAPGAFEGCVRTNGELVEGRAKHDALQEVWRKWVNDSFWLNPLGKFFDPGVQRSIVDVDGKPALLVTFTLNGVTPGDSYLWVLDDNGRPREWRMWTKIPIGGLPTSWEDWVQLPTGAWVATSHRMLGFNLEMQDVAGAATLEQLLDGAENPFAWCTL